MRACLFLSLFDHTTLAIFCGLETSFVSIYLDQFGMELHMGAPRHFVPFVFFVHKEYVRRLIALRLDYWHKFNINFNFLRRFLMD